MRKHFLKIFFFVMFLFSPLVVNAAFGDLRYEITDVNISESNITFKGWAFIHKTNNFNTITDNNGTIHYGGQKIRMRAINESTGIVLDTIEVNGSDTVNYNFYCELFYKTSTKTCTESNYKSISFNSCDTSNSNSYCYYEDIYFIINFDTSTWVVSDADEIRFQISASNTFFRTNISKYGKISDGNYTAWEDFNVPRASVSNFNNDYIEIDTGSIPDKVEFIATSGILLKLTDQSEKFRYDGKTTYGNWSSVYGATEFSLYMDDANYVNGRSKWRSDDRCEDFLKSDGQCYGSYNYAIYVKKGPDYDTKKLAIPGTYTDNIAVARGSHVKPTGTFKMSVKNDKKCDVTTPLPSELACNSSGTLSSTCDELTVHTDKGSAVVKIEQTGTVSSVLTPNSIYSGGGFKFGIMYQNNIKWSYVGSVPGAELHNAVNAAMNDKLKDYDAYVAGINISNLKLGDNNISSGMVKQCFTSGESKNYYGSEGLSVSCIFTFPSSTIGYDGKVDYTTNSSININNKYYTSFDKFGSLNVTATITGMDRITDNAAKMDSQDNNNAWTGTWEDNIDGCEINVYPLLYNSNGKYNFIYRPIDINNPFPNRNAGINWYDWYNIQNNKNRLENPYSELDYTAILDNNFISNIKNYNKNNNYLDWDSINVNTGESSFVNEYVERVGDN